MRLLRLAAGPNPSVSIILPPPWEYPVISPHVIVGSNGSGKSLLVSALLALFASGDDRMRRCENLRNTGIEQIRLDFNVGDRIAHVRCDTHDAAVSVEWEAAPGSDSGNHKTQWQSSPENELQTGFFGEPIGIEHLFRSVNILLAGKSSIYDYCAIRETVVQVLSAPIEKELAEWEVREKSLAGNGNEIGSLSAARLQLDESERDLERVEDLWRDYETALARKQTLEDKTAQTRRERDVSTAEITELDRLCTLAERAQRLDTWIEEIELENRKVIALREQHAAHQSRLDVLEEQFRGISDNFPDLLNEYETLRESDRKLAEDLSAMQQRRSGTRHRLEELQRELDDMNPPPEADVQELESLYRESATVNSELTELLRGRIELVRQREGARQKLQQDFGQFNDLHPMARHALDRLLTMDSKSLTIPPAPAVETDHTNRENRIAEIRRVLHEKFSGFDDLSPRTPEVIRELFELRQLANTKSGDIESLHKNGVELKRKLHPLRAMLWCLPVGVAAFAVGMILASWDIGLFTALAGSGVTLLILRLFQRRVDAEIESVREAEEMMQGQLTAALSRIRLLESSAGPLAQLKTLDGAMSRYADYQQYMRELENLLADHAANRALATSTARDSLNEIHAHLPAELADTPLTVIQKLYEGFLEREKQVRHLDNLWSEYTDGGDTALRIRELEDTAARLKQRQTELVSSAEQQRQTYESRKADLTNQIANLADEIIDPETERQTESKRSQVQERIGELDRLCQGMLSRTDGEVLRNEWHERESLKSKLREIRNSLSSYQTHDELRARETLLREEAAEVRHKLTSIDPLYMLQGNAAHYTAKYHAQRQSARETAESCDRVLCELQQEIETINTDGHLAALSQEPSLDELRRVMVERQNRVDEIERNLTTTRELIASIRSELDDMEQSAGTTLEANINLQVRELSNNRYRAVQHDNGTWTVELTDGGSRRLDILSDGTQDLLWLAIRIGVLETIQAHDANPVVWDEPFWRLDEEHLLQVRDALQRLSMSRQVILLTRQSALAAWGTALKMSPSGFRISLEAE
ncbi:MAG: hypothetical protein ACOZB3_09395 [Calditrichota bacterium]